LAIGSCLQASISLSENFKIAAVSPDYWSTKEQLDHKELFTISELRRGKMSRNVDVGTYILV
jgi:hypothetical protein